MAKKDLTVAQLIVRAAIIPRDSGPMPDERPPEHDRPHPIIPHPGADKPWLPKRVGGEKEPL